MEAGIAETERSIQSVNVQAEPALDMPRYSIFFWSRAYLAMSKNIAPHQRFILCFAFGTFRPLCVKC